MIILGIHDGFDAGAAVVRDGELLSAVNEERLSRIKFHAGHAHGWPARSITEALDVAGVMPREVDTVAVAGTVDIPFPARIKGFRPGGSGGAGMGKGPGVLRRSAYNFFCDRESGSLTARASRALMAPRFRGALAHLGVAPRTLRFVDHHMAHAAGAYYTGSAGRALAVTMDGHGDGLSGAISLFDGRHVERIAKTPSRESVGWFYSKVTHALGFEMHRHEGKVTGLAAHGSGGGAAYEALRGAIDTAPRGLGTRSRLGYKYDGLDRLRTLVERFGPEEVASAAQRRLEEVVCSVVGSAVDATGVPDVVAAGGTFANVRLNQRVAELPGVRSFLVHPHMGDGGLAVGAALARWGELGADPAPRPLPSCFLGRAYSDEEIVRAVIASGLPFRGATDIEERVAERLARGQIVARFHGRAEYGPRALGHRSILAPATERALNGRLNGRLGRTEFMPFAPVVLHGAAKRYFEGYGDHVRPCRFMTMTLDATPEARRYGAVIHVDGTARPQAVHRDECPSLHAVLEAYRRRTGLDMLVNTSFNLHGEPIVQSPEDALATFRAGCADVFAIGPFLVEHVEGEADRW